MTTAVEREILAEMRDLECRIRGRNFTDPEVIARLREALEDLQFAALAAIRGC